jgi:WD40 repeat protein
MASTATHPFFASADRNGTVRQWAPPSQADRIVVRGQYAIFNAEFAPDSSAVVTAGAEGLVRIVKLTDGHVDEFRASDGSIYAVRYSRDGSNFMAWGSNGAQVWRAVDHSLLRDFREHDGPAEEVDYVDDGETLVSIGRDGRVLSWPSRGTEVTERFRSALPLISMEPLGRNGSVAVVNSAGQVSVVPREGSAIALSHVDHGTVTMLKASPDGTLVATGFASGVVTVHDISSGEARVLLQAHGPIRHIAFSPDAALVVVASEDGQVHLRSLRGTSTLHWADISAKARFIAFSPDGARIALPCGDGGVWIYEMATMTWSFLSVHQSDVFFAQFSPDGRYLVTTDAAGLVSIHDFTAELSRHSKTNNLRYEGETAP